MHVLSNSRHLAVLYYFCYFGAAGSVIPYLNLYYERVGMSTQQIGALAALHPALILVAGPVWGGLADHFRQHQRLLPLLMRLTLPALAVVAVAGSFGVLALFIALFAMCSAPIIALADHAVLKMLGDQKHAYGRLRLWGAVGWGVGSGVTGYLIEYTHVRALFIVYIVVMFLGSLVAARLPTPRREGTTRYWHDIGLFLRDRYWQGFLASVFLFGVGLSMFNAYFVLYMDDLGAGEGLFGLSVVAASISEIPIFMFSTVILRRYSPRVLILLAFVALIVRCFASASISDPVWGIPTQLLHGPSFAAMWAAGVAYADQMSPPGLGASAQALFGAIQFGISGTAGALVGSQIYDTAGPVTMFQVGGVCAIVGLLFFLATEARAPKNSV